MKDQIFLRGCLIVITSGRAHNTMRYCTVSTCNCEHPPKDPFSIGQEFIYVGRSHTIQLKDYLDTAASRAMLSIFRRGAAYGGVQESYKRSQDRKRRRGFCSWGRTGWIALGESSQVKVNSKAIKSVLDD